MSNEATESSPRQSAMELLNFLVNEMEYEAAFFTSPAYHGPRAPKKKAEKETMAAKGSSGEKSGGALNPQNNPQEAYRLQRRNIVTFEDYCYFMGLEAEGPGPEGPATPLVLSRDFVADRRPVTTYDMSPLMREKTEPQEAAKKKATHKLKARNQEI